jgi:uncharacterized protein YjiS (DUF1127 family)
MYDGSNFKPLAADDAESVIALRHATDTEVSALLRRARAARSAAVAEAIAGAVAGVVLWFRGRRAKAAALRELQEMDARTLADIGITRDDIAELVYGARRAGPQLRGEMLVWFVENKLLRPFRAWRLAARTRNELMALDDASLRDIGVERGQIDGIAATVANAKIAGQRLPVAAALVLGGFEPSAPANSNLFPRREAVDAAD